MTDLTVRAAMTMDAAGLKAGGKEGVAAIDGVKTAVKETGAEFRSLQENIDRSLGLFSQRAKRSADDFAVFGGVIQKHANASRAAMANLSFQMNDIATGLLSGQSFGMILAQQGGQVFQIWQTNKDVFKDTATVITNLVTPARLAILGATGLGAALLGAFIMAEKYNEETERSEHVLELYGNRIGLTGQALRELADDEARVAGIGKGQSRNLLQGFEQAGGTTSSGFREYAELAAALARINDTAAEEMQGSLQKALRDPLAAAKELKGSIAGIDDELIEHIRLLVATGQQQEAGALLIHTWYDAVEKADVRTNSWSASMTLLGTAFNTTAKFLDELTSQRRIYDAYNPPTLADVAKERSKTGGELYAQFNNQHDQANNWLKSLNDTADPSGAQLRQIGENERAIRQKQAAGLISLDDAVKSLNLQNEKRLDIISRLVPAERAHAQVMSIKEFLETHTTQILDDQIGVLDKTTAAQKKLTDEREKAADQLNEQMRASLSAGLQGLSANAPASMQALRLQNATTAAWKSRMDDVNEINTHGGDRDLLAQAEGIYTDKMAQIEDDYLRRRTDWVAGIERGNKAIIASHLDMATRSEQALRKWDQDGEDTFVQFATKGKLEVGSLTDFVLEQLARMVYQQQLSGAFNSLGSSILGSIGSLVGGGAGAEAISGYNDGGAFYASVHHAGGTVGRGSPPGRYVHSSVFADAPRFHSGGTIGANEVPVIVEMAEDILNRKQKGTVAAALMGGGGAPTITVNLIGASGREKVSEPKRGSDGSFSMDIFLDAVDNGLADRTRAGNSALTNTIVQQHGLQKAF